MSGGGGSGPRPGLRPQLRRQHRRLRQGDIGAGWLAGQPAGLLLLVGVLLLGLLFVIAVGWLVAVELVGRCC